MMVMNGEPGWVCLMSCNIDRECRFPLAPVIDGRLRIPYTVLFDAVIVYYVTSRDNKGTQTTRSDKNNLSVAVERSVVIHSTNRTTVDRKSTISKTEEEIGLSNFGAVHAGTEPSTERMKGYFASDRSLDSIDAMQLGNKTDVMAAVKRFE